MSTSPARSIWSLISYSVGAYQNNGTDQIAFATTTVTAAAGLTFNRGRYLVGSFGNPTSTLQRNGYFGGNVLLASDTMPGVPEPATWAMMMLGFGVAGYTMRRRSKVGAHIRFA